MKFKVLYRMACSRFLVGIHSLSLFYSDLESADIEGDVTVMSIMKRDRRISFLYAHITQGCQARLSDYGK